MKKRPAHEVFERIDLLKEEGSIPEKYSEILKTFIAGYETTLVTQEAFDQYKKTFLHFLESVKKQCLEPFVFSPYHQRIRKPFDYYAFGLDMLRPLIDKAYSSLKGLEHFAEIANAISRGENVIFLANHQTEADPHAISLLLEEHYPKLAEEMIFVAGERVITDPLAVPFSMGRNLLCIYSKKYIDHPPEDKLKKQLHNKRTMELMSELLSEGGKAIYVAPSGGRDRPNSLGVVEVADYDPQSIEMFYLMANRAGHPTYFYPLTLKTHELLPPPQTIQIELGEVRLAKLAKIHLAVGPKIDMDNYPGNHLSDKHARRKARADYICGLVRKNYSQFL